MQNMTIENKFPKSGSKEELQAIGARHLSSDEFEYKGSMVRIEYMVYEREGLTVVWKKPVNSQSYLFHKKERVIESREVPVML